jgi:hypothetical protein
VQSLRRVLAVLEVEGAPPDQRAVSVASLGVLAFVVRRVEDAPIRILVALRVGAGGDPLGPGQMPVPLQRRPIGPRRR